MHQGYCPHCGRMVTTTREDIDVGLALFLLFCTGGIGLIIYLIIYYTQPEDKCVFCKTKVLPNPPAIPSQTTSANYYNKVNTNRSPQYNNNSANAPIPRPFAHGPESSNTGDLTNNNEIDNVATVGDEIFYESSKVVTKRSDIRYCPICGTEFILGQKFCKSCGASLEDVK
ncbi:MAG: hypothetical protein ACTSU2_11545 [Promethearchaeota archaeon]